MAETEKSRRDRERAAYERDQREREIRRKKEEQERRRRKEDHERYRMQQLAVKKQKEKKGITEVEASERTRKLVEELDRQKEERQRQGFDS